MGLDLSLMKSQIYRKIAVLSICAVRAGQLILITSMISDNALWDQPECGRAMTISESDNDAKLLRSALLLGDSMDVVHDVIILYDKDEIAVFTNDAFHEMYPHAPGKDENIGCTMEQVIQGSLDANALHNPTAKSEPASYLAKVMERRRQQKPPDYVIREPSGRSYLVRSMRTPEGGILVLKTDVTELENAKREIKKKSEHLEVEIVERRNAEEALRQLNRSLEQRVEQRIIDLRKAK